MERRLLLLGLLRRQEMHGYQLNEFIENKLAFCTDIKKPTAYYVLDKLAEEGHITEVDEPESQTARPPRKTYRITERGEAYFIELLKQNLSTYERHTFAVDTGVAFIEALSQGEARVLLQARRDELKARRQSLESIADHPGSLRLVIDHHIMHLETELRWLDRIFAWLDEQE